MKEVGQLPGALSIGAVETSTVTSHRAAGSPVKR